MATTSYQLPLAVTYNGPGVSGWTDSSNILLVDNQFASSSGATSILQVGNFNLNVPQSSDITNFTVKVKGYRGSFNTTLQIYAVDNTTGTEFSYPAAPFQSFTGTNTLFTLPSTLFGTTWTVNQCNNIQLKLIADGELHLDAIEISADYVAQVSPVPIPPSSGLVVVDEFVQGQRFQLSSSITDSELFIFTQSFTLPDGTPIQYADFYGTEAFITVDQGVPGLEENIRITAVDHNYQGTGLTRISIGNITNRGLKFIYPYDHDINLCRPHDGTAEFVISNSAPFYNRFLKKNQINALVSAPIIIEDESVALVDPAHTLDFQGAGVSVVNDGLDSFKKIVTIPGVGVNPPFVSSASSATSGGTQVASITWSHTSSGLNRLLIVQVETEAAQTISGITYNGIALAQKVTITNGTLRNEQWSLVAPTVGTYDIVVTLSGSAYLTCGAETFNTVDQVTPIGATQTATGTSLTPSLSLVTTADNSLIVDSLATGTLPMVYTVGVAQVENWKITTNPSERQGASSVEPSGSQPDSVTMSWAITQNVDWAQTALEINGIASAAPVVSGVTVQDTTPNVTVANVVKIVFPDGTVTNPAPGEADVDTTLLAATSADTTPNYLDPKFEIVSADSSVSITKTIQNPAANEKISYDLSVSATNINPLTSAPLFDDFIGGGDGFDSGGVDLVPDVGELGWTVSPNAVTIPVNNTNNHPGVIRMDSNGGSDQLVYLLNTIGDVNAPSSTYEAMVMLGNAANVFQFGIEGTGRFLGIASNGTDWVGRYVNGGTTNTGAVATTTSWTRLTIVTNGAGNSAEYFVDGVSLGTVAIATSGGTAMQITFRQATAVGNFDYVDYFKFDRTLTR